MTFDWFTIAAQLVNFLLLIYLLRRFLYGPIINFMDERQASINAQVEEAKTREHNAEQALTSVQGEQRRLQSERESLVEQARLDAETAKQSLLKEARAQVDAQRQQWQIALSKEKEDFIVALQKRVTNELYQSMRRALADLADVELEQQIIKVFIKRLPTLVTAEREALQSALVHTNNQVQLITAFALTASQEHNLKQALATVLAQDLSLNIEHQPELVCGLELNIFDQRLTWTLASYLNSLEKEVSHQLSSIERQGKLAVSAA